MSGLLTSGPDLAGAPRLTPSPGRRRALVVPLVLLFLVGLAGWQAVRDLAGPRDPGPLKAYVLDGPRSPNCLRLAIGMDVSGSMSDFATARDAALTQLQEWATRPNTLRSDDEMAIVDFAFEARTRLPPRPVAASAVVAAAPVSDGNATLLRPMLDRIKEFPPSACDTVLVLLSDAQISDMPANSAEGDALLRASGVHDVRFLVPGDAIQVPDEWARAFPSAPPVRFNGLDPEKTALIMGKTIAELTRQRLVPLSVPST